jgi:hypothetical protein
MEFKEFITAWNLPGWGIFLLCLITLIKTWPLIQKNLLDARETRETRHGKRIKDLEEAVDECRRECEEQKESMRAEMSRLQEQRLNDRAQNLQEQISLVSILVQSVDNPILQRVLEQLQTAKRVYELTGVVGDRNSQE